VHPQQMIHSMVEFVDGAVVAQIGLPTMLVPIAMGLAWPERVPGAETPVDWTKASDWRFEPLDDEAFPAIRLAREAGARGGTAPAVYNAANEECVAAFVAGRLPFLGIVDTVERVLSEHDQEPETGDHAAGRMRPLSLRDVLEAETWARARAGEIIMTVATSSDRKGSTAWT
jgi:1-deoxy-D-xylulose-5-phosphate reductoisomerase